MAGDYKAFVNLAAGFANDPASLVPLRQRLIANRFTAPLFDAARFCRNLEKAFTMMVDRARSGLEPVAFDVPAE